MNDARTRSSVGAPAFYPLAGVPPSCPHFLGGPLHVQAFLQLSCPRPLYLLMVVQRALLLMFEQVEACLVPYPPLYIQIALLLKAGMGINRRFNNSTHDVAVLLIVNKRSNSSV